MKPCFEVHPTVAAVQARSITPPVSKPLDAAWLRKLCPKARADDIGFVELERPALAAVLWRRV